MLAPEFRVRRIGQRYERGEVDAFVERVVATAERRSVGPDVTVDEVRGVAFSTPFIGPGYSAEEVDSFLLEAERWLPGRAVDRPADSQVVGHTPVASGRAAPRFSTVRFREGYAQDEVDAFVGRLMATVNGLPVDRPVTVQEIRQVQFSPVRLNEGYDVMEVDVFLETAEEWLSS